MQNNYNNTVSFICLCSFVCFCTFCTVLKSLIISVTYRKVSKLKIPWCTCITINHILTNILTNKLTNVTWTSKASCHVNRYCLHYLNCLNCHVARTGPGLNSTCYHKLLYLFWRFRSYSAQSDMAVTHSAITALSIVAVFPFTAQSGTHFNRGFTLRKKIVNISLTLIVLSRLPPLHP